MIRLLDVSKVFGTGVAGLEDVTLSIDKGEFVYLVGHTGSGKTTLLRLLTREVTPSKGTILIDNIDVANLPAHKIPHLRKKIGVVFQDLKLLMDRTIFENVLLPMQVAGITLENAKTRAEELLSDVGVGAHMHKFPIQLSGGELQRVAIARALTLEPEILLADEPTGNLDSDTAFAIVDLLNAINKRGTTILMATHNPDIMKKHPRRVVELEKGKIVRDHGGSKKPASSADKQEVKTKGQENDKEASLNAETKHKHHEKKEDEK